MYNIYNIYIWLCICIFVYIYISVCIYIHITQYTVSTVGWLHLHPPEWFLKSHERTPNNAGHGARWLKPRVSPADRWRCRMPSTHRWCSPCWRISGQRSIRRWCERGEAGGKLIWGLPLNHGNSDRENDYWPVDLGVIFSDKPWQAHVLKPLIRDFFGVRVQLQIRLVPRNGWLTPLAPKKTPVAGVDECLEGALLLDSAWPWGDFRGSGQGVAAEASPPVMWNMWTLVYKPAPWISMNNISFYAITPILPKL